MSAEQLNSQRSSHSTPALSVSYSVQKEADSYLAPACQSGLEGRGELLNPVPHRSHTSDVPLAFRARPQRTDALFLPSFAFVLRCLPFISFLFLSVPPL
jgi:hypothetical protein